LKFLNLVLAEELADCKDIELCSHYEGQENHRNRWTDTK